MKETYVQAVLPLLRDAETATRLDEVVTGLKKTLRARGHERLLPSILQSAARKLRGTDAHKPLLTFAKDAERAFLEQQEQIARDGERAHGTIQSKDDVVLTEDPNLIGGYTLRVKDTLVDRSYKTQLLNLYRNITT